MSQKRIYRLCRCFYIAFFGFLNMLSSLCGAEEWQWVHISPAENTNIDNRTWRVLQGITDLKIDGSHFSSQLSHADSKYLFSYLIDGDIGQNGIITATELQQYTESSPHKLTGNFESYRGPEGQWGYDRLILTGQMTSIFLLRFVKSNGNKH